MNLDFDPEEIAAIVAFTTDGRMWQVHGGIMKDVTFNLIDKPRASVLALLEDLKVPQDKLS